MKYARSEPKCVNLLDGKILVAGGNDGSAVVQACELYDPIADKWSVTGSLNQGRYRFSLVRLNDGRVLALGGLTDMYVATTETCELYDPAAGTWKVTASLPSPSENVAGLTLPNGEVFVAGGLNANNGSYQNFALLYDPSTETFTQLPNMPIACTGHLIYYSAEKNSVMVCGGEQSGFNGFYLRSTRIYSFALNQWSLGDSTIEPHDNGQIMAVTMPDGKPLLVSGRSDANTLTQNVEAYDWNSDKWSHVGQTIIAQWHCYAFRIGDDSILLVGGSTPDFQVVSPHSTWYRYSTSTSWPGPDLITSRYLYTGLVYDLPIVEQPCAYHESVYIFGGTDSNNIPLNTCEVLSLGLKRNSAPPILEASDITFPTRQSCNAFDTSIAVMYVGCGSGAIDSIVSETSAAVASIAGPVALGSGDTVSVPLHIALTDTTRTAKLLVYGVSSAGPFTKEISVSLPALSPAEIAFATASLDLKNGGSVKAGDTITVPVQVRIASPSASRGYTLSLAFDSNALELVKPDYTGTLSVGTTSQTWTQYSTGATLTIPTSLTVSNGTLLNLRFRAYLSKNPCTTLRIFGSQFETSDSLLACTLPADSDSVQICVGAACVETQIRDLWSGQSISIDGINVSDGQLNISVGGTAAGGWGPGSGVGGPGGGTGEFEFYDIMGRQIVTPNVISTAPSTDGQTAHITFDIRSLPAGPYFVRMEQNGASSSKEFIVK
jgi:hypothetical protein